MASLFHNAAVVALGLELGARGVITKVAKTLGEDVPNYSRRVAGGKTSEAVLIRWMTALEENTGGKLELRFVVTEPSRAKAAPVPTVRLAPRTGSFANIKAQLARRKPGTPLAVIEPTQGS
jgi:hypothetical protein